jgi:hypothetical protein
MTVQYDVRRDALGWTVFDRGGGQAIVLGRSAQAGLSWFDADELADRLNRRKLICGVAR